jgi:WS/DGAT/MGAT family acyltransferase
MITAKPGCAAPTDGNLIDGGTRVKASATPSTERRLSALDASYLYNESATNPLHIGAVLVFEGHIPFDSILKSLEQRLPLVPRFRQRLAEVPFDLAFPSWENDPDFRLENHIRRFELPIGISQQEAIGRVLREYHPMLNRGRPLWEFHCFERWLGQHTAVVCKFHHALADGVSGVKLIKRLFDFSSNARLPELPPQRNPAAPLPSPSQRLVNAARDLAISQVRSFTAMLEAIQHPSSLVEHNRRLEEAIGKIAGPPGRRIVAAPWNDLPLTGLRELVWFRRSFADCRAIRNSLGGSTDDVLLTVLSEGAGRYLKHHGYSTNGYFRIAYPVNVRRSEEQLEGGNRVSMIFPTIPARPMETIERHRLVREETGRIKPDEVQSIDRLGLRWTGAFGSPFGTFPAGVFTSTLMNEMTPPGMAALAARTAALSMDAAAAFIKANGSEQCLARLAMPPPAVSFVTSHIASAQAPAFLCGHRCLEQIGILPICEGLGMSVMVLSYNQSRCIGMCGDLGVMPDLERMKYYVEESFNELGNAAAQRGRTMKASPGRLSQVPDSGRSAAST